MTGVCDVTFVVTMVEKMLVCTVEPRFNEVPRDNENWFVISRVRYIEVLFHAYILFFCVYLCVFVLVSLILTFKYLFLQLAAWHF